MKTVKLFFIVLVYATNLIQPDKIFGQNYINQNKIEAIIQLAKFVDWSQNRTFCNSKRLLYILTDNQLTVNNELRPKNLLNFKNWQIKYSNNLNEIEKGSVIFITKGEKENVKKAINLSKTEDVITISDNMPNFCQKGGMINLIEKGEEIEFEINYRIIQNKSLVISSKVLALAKIYD